MSLQKLCLVTIAKSLDRHIFAFAAADTQDASQRYYILQRFYGQELLFTLIKRRLLKEQHASFVFNKYLKSLDVDWFPHFSWETIHRIFSEIGLSLEKVIFCNKYYPVISHRANKRWRDVFCTLRNVRSITYKYYCDDYILYQIATYCPRLEILNIENSASVTDCGMQYFCDMERGIKRDRKGKWIARTGKLSCPMLKEITLQYMNISVKYVRLLLNSLPFLRKLDYNFLPFALYEIHNDDLESLDSVPKYNLMYMDLFMSLGFRREHDHLYDDILKLCLTLCPKLKFLYCHIQKSEQLDLCSELTNIKNLQLQCTEESNINVNDFVKEKGCKLTSLSLENCTVSIFLLGQHCVMLNKLKLSEVTIQYNKEDPIVIFDKLKEFTVDRVDLTRSNNSKGICLILKSSPALEVLKFELCSYIPTDVKTQILKCCEQCSLKYINFYDATSLELNFLTKVLMKCSTLETLACYRLFDRFLPEFGPLLKMVADSVPNKPKMLIDDFEHH